MSWRYRVLLGLVLTGIGWYYATRAYLEPAPVAPHEEISSVSISSAPVPAPVLVPVSENAETPKDLPKIKSWPENPFSFQRELDQFSQIKTKVFLSESEEADRKRLLSDSALMRAISLRLTEASLAPSVLMSQDQAVDLLIDALKSGDKEMASEVAKAIVEDPQIENAQLDAGVRANLAGIKAEVMYHWTAITPEAARGFENALPGPVSRKIWNNVSHRQASNTAEERGP